MSSKRIADYWGELRGSPAPSNGRLLKLVHSVGQVRVFAAIDVMDGLPSLVFEGLSERLVGRSLRLSGQGYSVSLVGGLQGDGESPLLQFKLMYADAEDLFACMCDALVQTVRESASGKATAALIVEEIERWKCFFRTRKRALSTAEVVGLIGELAVLSILACTIRPRDALDGWRAPAGSIRDFELRGVTIEVKAYSQSTGGRVTINGPLQLEPETGRLMVLACQEVVADCVSGAALPVHVAEAKSRLVGSQDLSADFERMVASRGYLESHASLYEERFSLGALSFFRVADSFPRILPDAIPPGVEDVRFNIGVASLAPFAVREHEFLQSTGSTHVGEGRR